jgi:deaminated glutathione amidase
MAQASKIVAAVVQMSSQADVEANLARAGELVEQAVARGAELVVLPENFAFMGSDDVRRMVAERIGGSGADAKDKPASVIGALARVAAHFDVHIVAGGMPERSTDPDRPYNTAVVVGPDGSILARYRKMHLFDVDVGDGTRYAESASTLPGDTPVTATVLGFRLGLSICYDVRFPELYRALTDQGAEILAVPSAFTLLTGKDHWHVLLRARAIEAQAYVLAAAQWGAHPRGRRTFGKSVIVDPWGEVIAQCSEGEGIAVAEVEIGRAHV